LPGKSITEMIYTLSGGMLNPTHSLCFVQRTCSICIHCCNVTTNGKVGLLVLSVCFVIDIVYV